MDFFLTEGVFRGEVVAEAEVVVDTDDAGIRFGEIAVRACSRNLVENLVVVADVTDFVEYQSLPKCFVIHWPKTEYGASGCRQWGVTTASDSPR